MEPKTKNIVMTTVVIILAIFLVCIMYFLRTPEQTTEQTNTNEEQTVNQDNIVDTSPEPLPMAQVYFNESISTEPQGAKSQVVHGIIFPILQTIFNLAPASPEGTTTDNVKLRTYSDDNKLVYVFNRTCTDQDLENFKIALKTLGGKIKSEINPITVEYSSMNFTFNFWLNDQQKGGVEVSF